MKGKQICLIDQLWYALFYCDLTGDIISVTLFQKLKLKYIEKSLVLFQSTCLVITMYLNKFEYGNNSIKKLKNKIIIRYLNVYPEVRTYVQSLL